MPRIQPIEEGSNPELAGLIDEIKRARGGKLLVLYKMLLNSPPVAHGWLQLLSAIRQQCSLSARVRELVILRIAVLNRADYEFEAHVSHALAEGIPQDWIDALRRGTNPPGASALEQAALEYDVCLLSEEYDPVGRRMLGNFPQALTHVAVVNTARTRSAADGAPARVV